MELTPTTKKILIALTALLLFLIIIYLAIGPRNDNGKTTPSVTPSGTIGPTSLPPLQITLAIPKSIKTVPTLPYSRGGGIDTNSTIVRESEINIQKLLTSLPYQKTFKTSNGLEIEVLIPPAELQENRWTLTASVYGIDYEVPPNTPEYVLMRTAFREGAADIFTFIRKQGVEPESLIFKWGGRIFIEERAEEWLQ